eukprot:1316370-Prymnesium_polylepis.1
MAHLGRRVIDPPLGIGACALGDRERGERACEEATGGAVPCSAWSVWNSVDDARSAACCVPHVWSALARAA